MTDTLRPDTDTPSGEGGHVPVAAVRALRRVAQGAEPAPPGEAAGGSELGGLAVRTVFFLQHGPDEIAVDALLP